jgi:hypothetical protein
MISSAIRKVGPFVGNGSASIFPFTFKVFSKADLVVVRTDTATATDFILVVDSDYTVSLNADQDGNPGGSITLTAGALATGATLIISSDIGQTQATQLTNLGGFYPEVITNAFDRLTILIQQLQEQADRSVRFPISDAGFADLPAAAQRVNKLMAFGSDGAISLVTSTPDGLTVGIANGSAATLKSLNSIRFADQFPGSDIGAKINAAFADLGGNYGTVYVPAGAYSYSTTIYFSSPSRLLLDPGAILNYTGSGKAVKMGPDGLTVSTYHNDPYIVEGGQFIGGSSATHGIYFNEFITTPRVFNVRFDNFGSTTNYGIFFQSSNWDIVIDGLRMWWTASPNAARNGIRVNGVNSVGTADFGQSKFSLCHSRIQSLTTAGGHGLWLNGAYGDAAFCTVAGLDVVLDWQANGCTFGPKFYMETTSNAIPYGFSFGQPSGSHIGAFLTQLVFDNCYCNLHNSDFGTSCSFLGPSLPGGTGSGLQNLAMENCEFSGVSGGTKIVVLNDKASQINNKARNNLVNDSPVTAAQLHTSGGSISNWLDSDGDTFQVGRPISAMGVLFATISHRLANGVDTAGYTANRAGISSEQTSGFMMEDKDGEIARVEAVRSGRLSLIRNNVVGLQIDSTGAAYINKSLVSYNGIATVSNGVPAEYATVDLTAQGAAIAAITAYTPTADGMYRVSWVATITRAGSVSSTLGGSSSFQLKYTDANDSLVKTTAAPVINSAANTTGTSISGTLVAYCKASTALQYIFGYTDGGGTTMQYNLHFKVEAL